MTKKDVPAKVPENKGVVAYDYGEHAGAGAGDIDRADLMLPFLTLLQTNSPQVAEGGEKFVPGAKAGMFIHSVTNELFDGTKGVLLQPVYTERLFGEWVDRDKGGGFRGNHHPGDDIVRSAKPKEEGSLQLILPNGNDLVECFYMFALLLPAVGSEVPMGPIVFGFTSKKIKWYKRYMTIIKSVRGGKDIPIYAHQLLMTSWNDKAPKGVFKNVMLDPAVGKNAAESLLPPGHPLLEHGAAFREQIVGGAAKVDYAGTSGGGGGGDAEGDEVF